MTPAQARAAAELRCWDRIAIGVRCAYNSGCPCALRHYLEAGRRVVAVSARSEQQAQQHMLTVLLQTARDETLPWYWRSVCLEHTTYSLARLQSLLRQLDPIALEALRCAVQSAHDELGSAVTVVAPLHFGAPARAKGTAAP